MRSQQITQYRRNPGECLRIRPGDLKILFRQHFERTVNFLLLQLRGENQKLLQHLLRFLKLQLSMGKLFVFIFHNPIHLQGFTNHIQISILAKNRWNKEPIICSAYSSITSMIPIERSVFKFRNIRWLPLIFCTDEIYFAACFTLAFVKPPRGKYPCALPTNTPYINHLVAGFHIL